MARLVRHDRQKPYQIRPEGVTEPIFICAYGLSQNKPYCDGPHERTRDEGDGFYAYDEKGRTRIVPFYPS
jgi:CDGSH-type Zn-finger protein